MSLTLPVPLTGHDLAAYEALHSGAAVFVRPALHHLEFTGAKAAHTLTGLITNDVLALAEGAGQYAAALTAKGRVVADMRVIRLSSETFLTSTTHAAWPGWHELVRKFVNPRFAKYAEVALHTRSVHGPSAGEAVRAVMARLSGSGAVVLPEEPYASTAVTLDEGTVRVVRSPDLGDVTGFDLLVPPALLATVDRALGAIPGLVTGTESAWHVARVESGRPEWGRDMNDTTIPQEANLETLHAISFDKGCYTGQETVARIHFRGHVNRHLRVLTSAEPLPVPSEIRTDDGKVIGDVRSSALSPRVGPVAIAMLRRELGVGDTVSVYASDSTGTELTVVAEVSR